MTLCTQQWFTNWPGLLIFIRVNWAEHIFCFCFFCMIHLYNYCADYSSSCIQFVFSHPFTYNGLSTFTCVFGWCIRIVVFFINGVKCRSNRYFVEFWDSYVRAFLHGFEGVSQPGKVCYQIPYSGRWETWRACSGPAPCYWSLLLFYLLYEDFFLQP